MVISTFLIICIFVNVNLYIFNKQSFLSNDINYFSIKILLVKLNIFLVKYKYKIF